MSARRTLLKSVDGKELPVERGEYFGFYTNRYSIGWIGMGATEIVGWCDIYK